MPMGAAGMGPFQPSAVQRIWELAWLGEAGHFVALKGMRRTDAD